jgi:hypothetical protein
MKTRSGFVSNSSSSSFVVKKEDLTLDQFLECISRTYTQYTLITKNGKTTIEFPEYTELVTYLDENQISYEKRF